MTIEEFVLDNLEFTQKMATEEMSRVSADLHQRESDIELIGGERGAHSGPLSGPLSKRVGRRSAKFNVPESSAGNDIGHSSGSKSQDEEGSAYVDITTDIQGDSVALHSIKIKCI